MVRGSLSAIITSYERRPVPAAEELGSSRPRVPVQGHEGGVPRERVAARRGAGRQRYRRLRVQLQATGHGLRVALGWRREEPDFLPVHFARPSGHLPRLLPRRLAGDLPKRGSPFFLLRRPVRPTRRGEQSTLGL